MRQQARADNLTICYRKKTNWRHLSCVCPVIDNEFCCNIVTVVTLRIYSAIASWIHMQLPSECYAHEIHDQ